jgi:transcriptional regulator with XRE-family HTH domain
LSAIGDRLRRERERLGLSQTDFAALAGASKRAQIRYEAGERSPDAEYLARLARHGVDVLWVITGKRR